MYSQKWTLFFKSELTQTCINQSTPYIYRYFKFLAISAFSPKMLSLPKLTQFKNYIKAFFHTNASVCKRMINLLSNLFIKIYICRHFKTVLAPMPICSMPHHPRPIKLWPLPEHAPLRVISSSSSSFSYSSGCCVLWRQWLPFLWQYYGIYHYITYMDPPSLFNIVINSVHNSYCSCVPDEHRALALGMQWVILRLLGNVIRSYKII